MHSAIKGTSFSMIYGILILTGALFLANMHLFTLEKGLTK
jgi:hypothetical protein